MLQKNKQTGVTLLELLIVIAIIGIITAIGLPYYGDHVTRTRRADAHLVLMTNAQMLERCKATSYTYVGCPINDTSGEGDYNIKITAQSNSWEMTATAINRQSRDTECAEIVMNDLGLRTPESCWPE